MSLFYSNTDDENLQDFLNEKLEKLTERVKYKDSITPKFKNILTREKLKYFEDCGKFLGINKENEVVAGNFCKNRFCPVCNRRYASQKWHKVKCIAEQLKIVFRPCFALLTLTVENVTGEKLSEEITRLMKSIDRLHKTSLWKNNVIGYFRSLEVTYNSKKDTYHPHYHYILCLDKNYKNNMIPTWQWRQTWERSARLNYPSQVKIQIIKDDDTLSGGIAEVAKYAVKISSVIEKDSQAIKPLEKALKGRRLISYGGAIKEIAKQYDKNEKQTLKEKDKYPVEYYEYKDGKYKRKEWEY